jgi:hypothetical protein
MNFPNAHPEESSKPPGYFGHADEEEQFSASPGDPSESSENWDLVSDNTPEEDVHCEVDGRCEERSKDLQFIF